MNIKNSNLDFEAINANKNITVRNYWKARLENSLPEDYFGKNKTKEEAFRSEKIEYTAEESLYRILDKMAGSPKAKHIVLLAALGILARKYSSYSDIIIFTSTYADNKNADAPASVFPVRMKDFDHLTFPQFLTGSKDHILNDYKHSNYQLKKILNLEDEEVKQLSSVGMMIEGVQHSEIWDRLSPDFLFKFNTDDQLSLNVVYNAEKYDEQKVSKIAERYFHLLGLLISNKEKEINSVELISDHEKHIILKEFNDTEKDYPRDKTILDLFIDQVGKTPGNTAVSFKNEKLSYKELDEKSNQVAHYLKDRYDGDGRVFGVQMDRSLDFMVVIYGILKAGGTYLPISKSHPIDRILYTLENSDVTAVFTDTDSTEDFNAMYETLHASDGLTYPNEAINLAKPEGIAYIIYTSGSTGKPKGVLIKHTSVVNRLNWMQNEYLLNETDAILQKTPAVFDVSVWELFLWSFSGAKLVLANPGAEKSPEEISEIIEKENITVLHFVPSMLNAFLVYLNENGQNNYTLKSIKHLFTSGEELKVADAEMFLNYCKEAQLHNLYGPTEATVDVSFHNVSRTEQYRSIPIGKPIDNTQLLICNHQMQLQPVGLSGELFIGGVNLSVGYANQPQLTQERFIENPFNAGNLLYKTGDLARWLEDGSIEYMGRIDNQVKIRGNRIELGEIEFVMHSFPLIKTAVVLPKETKSGVQLVGYLVTDEHFSEETFREFLESKLPEYMIPSYFINVDKIPVTINGKVNRDALLSLQIQSAEEYAAPETDAEKLMLTYWTEVLSTEKIGINDSFFRVGGDSILAIRLISIINKELSSNISMIDLYENDTIKKLADYIPNSEHKGSFAAFEEITREVDKFNADYQARVNNDNIENVYPMSDIEKAMWFLHKSRPDEVLYFEQIVQKVAYENFNLDLLQQALDIIIQKHEILRTGFDLDYFAHIVYRHIDTSIIIRDYSNYERVEQRRMINEYMEASRSNHFNVPDEKLWRIIVYKLNDHYHEILIEYHHTLLDGWSYASLMMELNNIYMDLLNGIPVQVEQLEVSFKDLIVQELFYKQNKETQEFWKKELKDYKRLSFPKTTHSITHESVRKPHAPNLIPDLEKVAKQLGSTVKSMLFSAFVYSLKTLSGESDILVGLVTFSRPLKKDGDKMLGCFLNTVPVRVKIQEQLTWKEYIAQIDKKLLEVKKYDNISLFEINNAVGSETITGNPLTDTHFNYIDWHVTQEMNLGKIIDDEDMHEIETFLKGGTFFDINYNVTNKQIFCMHEYSSPYMTESRYAQYEDIFLSVLDQFIENTDVIIDPDKLYWNKLQENIVSDFDLNESSDSSALSIVPVLYHQEKLWNNEIEKGTFFRKNLSVLVNISDTPDSQVLEDRINNIINKYDILRSVFVKSDNGYFQRTEPQVEIRLDLKTASAPEDIQHWAKEEKDKPFTIEEPLVKALLIKLEESNQYTAVFTFHSSVIDSHAAGKIVQDILSVKQPMEINSVSTENAYLEYATWKKNAAEQLFPVLSDYWKNQLKDTSTRVHLPFTKLKPSSDALTMTETGVQISEDTTAKVLRYADENNFQPGIVLMAAFKILLNKYSQEERFLIGTKISGRDLKTQHIIGPFAGTLLIGSQISGNSTFDEYVTQLSQNYKEGQKNSLISSDIILSDMIMKDAEYPMLDVLFLYSEIIQQSSNVCGKLEVMDSFDESNLILEVENIDGLLSGKIRFNTSLSSELVHTLADQYAGIVEKLIHSSSENLSTVSVLSEEEFSLIKNVFNGTDKEFPSYPNILALLDESAVKFSDHTAIHYMDTELSYRDFWEISKKYGNYLRSYCGVKKGDLVGVLLDPDDKMVCSLYGILAAGGAYIPIDTNLPASRIETIIKDSGLSVLLTKEHYTSGEMQNLCTLVDVEREYDTILGCSHIEWEHSVHRDDLAYVIYTSGSTGNPKGVMISHGALLNLVQSMDDRYPLYAEDKFLLRTSYSFDISVAELFGWMQRGGGLVLLGKDKGKDMSHLLNTIKNKNITHINFVPSMLVSFIDAVNDTGIEMLKSLKYIFSCGEALPLQVLHSFKSLSTTINLENLYGPTEATVYTTVYSTNTDEDVDGRVSIGKPLDNLKMYVLDKEDALQPIGVWGELCIGGAGLATGYLHNESLTQEKFINAAWLESERLYKTGDIGRWLPDGNLDIMGRLDHQIKLRGYRIELGDVENKLMEYAGIKNSVVCVKEVAGDLCLVGYYISDSVVPQQDLREYLLSLLPEYMIPQHFIHMESFPLNSSGKISRNHLPEVELVDEETYVGASNDIEEKLLDIWSEVLNVDRPVISITKSFFELGGHSLKAMMLINKINKQFEIIFPLEEVFGRTTIEKQAIFIQLIGFLDNDVQSFEIEGLTENITI